MIIPIGSNLRVRRTPVVTIGMMVTMVLVYGVMAARGGRDPENLGKMLAVWGYMGLDRPMGLLTHPWIHLSPFAMIANLFFLYIMGSVVEDRLGHIGLLLSFLGGAIASAITVKLLASPESGPIVGPTAGLAAVTGVFTALAPRSRIRILIIVLLITTYEIPATWVIALSVVKDLFFGYSGMDQGLTFLAMALGFGLGFGVGMLGLATKLVPRQEFDILFVLKQQQRLRELRAAHAEHAASRLGAGAVSDTCAAARARISERLTASDWPGVIQAFDEFAATAGVAPDRPILNRRVHLEAANSAFAGGLRVEAARLYARFLQDHPADAEAPHVRLILAVILIRYAQPAEPGRAAELLAGLRPRLTSPDDQAIYDVVSEELRPSGTAPAETR